MRSVGVGRLFLGLLMVGATLATTPAGAAPAAPDCTGVVPETLTDRTAVSGTLAHGESACIRMTVTAADPVLRVNLAGPTEDGTDLDLYVRHGAAPTSSLYDCRPFTRASSESCRIGAPAAGEWFILVDAFGTGGDFVVAASVGCAALISGAWMHSDEIAAPGQPPVCFSIDVPPGSPSLVVLVSTALDDTRRFGLRLGSRFEAGEALPCTSNRVCTVETPEPGRWYVGVTGTYSAMSVRADVPPRECPALAEANNVFSVYTTCFSVEVPDGTDVARFVSTYGAGGTHVSESADPTATPSCRFSTEGYCAVSGPETSTLYIHYASPSLYPRTLDIAFEQAEVATGIAVGRMTEPGDGRMYRFDGLPDDAVVSLVGGSWVELVVRRGSPPTAADHIDAPFRMQGPRCPQYNPGRIERPSDGLWVAPTVRACTLPAGDATVYAFVSVIRPTETLATGSWRGAYEFTVVAR